MRQFQRLRIAGEGRRGVATVELAACLPLLTLVLFGSIQATDLIFMKHALTAAAYEGCLELSKPYATNQSVKARVRQVLKARKIRSRKINILPSKTKIKKTSMGTPVTVEVTADVAPNMTIGGFFLMPDKLSCQLVATK